MPQALFSLHVTVQLDWTLHVSTRTGNFRHWRPVLFTDESRFTVSTNDRRIKVWRRQGECYADCNIVEVADHGGGSVMVWGGMSLDGCTDFHVFVRGGITAARHRNKILEPIA